MEAEFESEIAAVTQAAEQEAARLEGLRVQAEIETAAQLTEAER